MSLVCDSLPVRRVIRGARGAQCRQPKHDRYYIEICHLVAHSYYDASFAHCLVFHTLQALIRHAAVDPLPVALLLFNAA